MIKGETILTGAPETCPDCGIKLKLQVCMSGAGYYIGTYCNCGPYSRESGYFKTRKEADSVLREWENGNHIHARTTEFKGVQP